MIPKSELPREKIIKNGVENLSDEELLCILLRTGTRDCDMFELAHQLLKGVGGIGGLATARLGELLDISGIKLAKACSILASVELGKRINHMVTLPKAVVHSMNDVYELIKHRIVDPYQEQLFVVCINSRKEVLACTKLFKGTSTMHLVHPRDIFREAVKNNADFIVLAHNHPSGNVTPSEQDFDTTREVVSLGAAMGIMVVDHLIIGNEGFLSMRAQGYLAPENT